MRHLVAGLFPALRRVRVGLEMIIVRNAQVRFSEIEAPPRLKTDLRVDRTRSLLTESMVPIINAVACFPRPLSSAG